MQSTSLFCFSEVCLCVIEWTIGVWTSVKVLYHERDRENGPLFQALRDDALCSTETVRSMALVVQRSLFFTLEELGCEEPATEAGRALAWPFFLVWEKLLSVEVIEEERKASKRQSSSDRWIEKSRKKVIVSCSSSGVHAYMSQLVIARSIKRRAAPAARSTGRRAPRDRGC